jgi:hypothetical protein
MGSLSLSLLPSTQWTLSFRKQKPDADESNFKTLICVTNGIRKQSERESKRARDSKLYQFFEERTLTWASLSLFIAIVWAVCRENLE